MLGEKLGAPERDEETMHALFKLVHGGLDHDAAPREPGTIQWDFPDADPWHLVVSNGDTRVAPGRAPDPTVTLEVGYEDLADLIAGRVSGPALALRRRMRPRGDLRWLWQRAQHVPALEPPLLYREAPVRSAPCPSEPTWSAPPSSCCSG